MVFCENSHKGTGNPANIYKPFLNASLMEKLQYFLLEMMTKIIKKHAMTVLNIGFDLWYMIFYQFFC